MLTEYIDSLFDRGLFEEYSNDHFIIRAKENDIEYFGKYEFFMTEHNPMLNFGTGYSCIPQNFMINLSSKLYKFKQLYGKVKVEEFIRNQLAAGKSNYDEDQFIRALSEIHILIYFGMYIEGTESLEYEPKLIQGIDTNPEAVIKLEEGKEIAVEVKTAGFKFRSNLNIESDLYFRPNVIMKSDKLQELKKFSETNNVNFLFPNVLKLKDFINSAGSKFLDVTDARLNLLFINWTYNDFKNSGLNEPISLFMNSATGILCSEESCNEIGLSMDTLYKISIIIFYKDNFHTMLSGDFRYQFAYNTVFAIPINISKEKMIEFTKLTNIPSIYDYTDNVILYDRSDGVKKNIMLDSLLYANLKELMGEYADSFEHVNRQI